MGFLPGFGLAQKLRPIPEAPIGPHDTGKLGANLTHVRKVQLTGILGQSDLFERHDGSLELRLELVC